MVVQELGALSSETNLNLAMRGGLIQLYGLIIHQKFGAAEPFEYKFAKILTNFALGKEPREKIWVLEQEGQIRGSDPCALVIWRKCRNQFFFIMINEEGNLSISY